jgi:hypothetical protein
MLPVRTDAATQLLAITGDAQPGVAGAQLQSITQAALNDAGQAALLGTLKVGAGGVTAANNGVAWLLSGGGKQSLARTATGGAPGAGVDPFTGLQSVSIDNNGTAAISATLASVNQGVWRYPGGSGSLVAMTNVSAVPEVAGAKYDLFLGGLTQSTSGAVVLNGRMAQGIGGVTLANDRAVWLYEGANSALVTREGLTNVPGVSGGKFQTPTATSLNASGQASVIASMAIMDEVNSQNSLGVWRLAVGGGDLVARRGAGNVGGVPSASFDSFDNVTINAAGQMAFNAGLALNAGVATANSAGIWKSTGGPGNQLVARSGSGGVPGIAGADFNTFGAPLLNDAGQILFRATLASGVGGVTDGNSIGLWSIGSGGDQLVARTGSGNVPGVAGASFADFGTLAFNAAGFAEVRGTLAAGAGGVSSTNDVGLWILNASGGGVLIAREGGALAGRTIADLDFTGGSAGGDGHVRALNQTGQLLFKATFTNGDEGLFLYTPASTADFNGDGLVNAADLASWKLGFGTSPGAAIAQGDADHDGDVDGGDFLQWQRQITPSGAVAAAPEPAAQSMLLSAVVAMCLRLKRGASVVTIK